MIMHTGTLSLAEFSRINRQRAERWHPQGLQSWSLSDWATALSGEVGELCNIIKKLNRIRDGIIGNTESEIELQDMLWPEIADVFIYLDLLAQAAHYDLATAVRLKFNTTSVKNDFPERLTG